MSRYPRNGGNYKNKEDFKMNVPPETRKFVQYDSKRVPYDMYRDEILPNMRLESWLYPALFLQDAKRAEAVKKIKHERGQLIRKLKHMTPEERKAYFSEVSYLSENSYKRPPL